METASSSYDYELELIRSFREGYSSQMQLPEYSQCPFDFAMLFHHFHCSVCSPTCLPQADPGHTSKAVTYSHSPTVLDTCNAGVYHRLDVQTCEAALGTLPKKINGIFWEFFPKGGGGGLFKSQNFCKFTKCFFVCQNHS